MTRTSFIVMSSSAKMPSSCWGRYRRVAVIEMGNGTIPSMISKHARGVVRIIETWERLNVGKTDKCAYDQALMAADALRSKLEQRRISQRFGS